MGDVRVGEVHPVTVDSLGAGGVGVGRLSDGRVVFIPRTATGDQLRVRLRKVKPRWCQGELEAVEVPGPARREAPCSLYSTCGGCALQHVEYEVQVEAKGAQVEDALSRIGGLVELPHVELHPSPREFHYRNRITLHLQRGVQGAMVAGFRHRSHPAEVVDMVHECLLPEEEILEVWKGLRNAWGRRAGRLPRGPDLRLTLRGVKGGGVVLLVEEGEGVTPGRGRVQHASQADGEPHTLLEEVPGLSAIWIQRHHDASPRLLAGDAEVEESWMDEQLPVQPGAFTQVNREAAALLHDLVLEEVPAPRESTVVDAYCGFGVYGRRLARLGAQVTGVELDERAVAMGRARRVPGFTLRTGRVEDLLEELLPADVVILNPPRGGVDEKVASVLAHGDTPRIIYVSCDPATLARDLGRLAGSFRLTRLQVVDLFPQTAHVETVATLDAVKPPVESQV
ncbi:MAG: 23S rRNA (uracil(1939)-C(5))-methyltransferase RlmD [Gemmatimonadota bacterium]